jgi:hypothetical protein
VRFSLERKLQALESTAKTPPLAKTRRKLVPPLQQLQLLEKVLRHKLREKNIHHIHIFGFHYVSQKYRRMISDLYFISGL